jgi:hypothetical protein
MMIAKQRAHLEALHCSTGRLLRLGHRLLAAVVVMGTLFCMLSMALLNLLQQPEAFLNTQAFMFNYAEAARLENAPGMALDKAPVLPAKPKDPNWDGTLAGTSVGFNLGQNIPMVGLICGPVLGAILGYELDSRI